jgi:nucleoside-diphosphate-sugar epimerase
VQSLRALVIGGTGLISTALVRQLLERGDHVVVYNRGLAAIPLPEGVGRIVGDRADPRQFAADLAKAGTFDAVFDMICYQPQDARGLIEVFAKRAGRVLVASTVDAYIKPAAKYPIDENAPLGGINDYGRGKAKCEELLFDAYEDTGFPFTTLRLVHCYGPGGAHRGHIVHSLGGRTILLDRLRKGKAIVVHGDGSSLWTSYHIEDVARAFLQAAESERTLGRAYNLSGDETVTWDQYQRLVAAAMNAPDPEIVHIPTDLLARLWPARAATAADNFRFNNIFDNSAAKRDFEFTCRIPLREGLAETIAWVDRTYGFDNSDDDHFYDELIRLWRESCASMEKTAEVSRKSCPQS